MKRFFYLLFLLTVNGLMAHADDLRVAEISEVVQKSLLFLNKTQFAQDTGYYVVGEFPVEMKSYLVPSLVGLGRPLTLASQEPTAFATASILNLLSEAFLIDPTLESVPNIIRNALPSFHRYRQDDIFFYYPLTDFDNLSIHAPLDPHYVPRKMLSLALVPPDADTTSVSFTALAFADLILKHKPIATFKIPDETLATLEKFRDLNRLPHLYNRLISGVKDSGAFMTWLWDENSESSSFFKSMHDPPSKGYRIIFGRNDIDCVVNANVLRLLSLTQNQNQEGFANSCQFLNDSIVKSHGTDTQAKFCGLYYPNTFGAIYFISNAYRAGASCLTDSRTEAMNLILSRQNDDGSWSNDQGIGREDRVQTTASAMGALLNYIEPSDRRFVQIIRRGALYLISQSRQKDASVNYWPGEVFFSAGPAARNTILWRSDSYTTALCLLSLVKAEAYLKGENP